MLYLVHKDIWSMETFPFHSNPIPLAREPLGKASRQLINFCQSVLDIHASVHSIIRLSQTSRSMIFFAPLA